MKRILFLASLFFVLCSSQSFALTIPFEVGDGGSVAINSVGLGIDQITPLASGPFYLGEGDTTPLITFFDVQFLALASGSITATIELISPDPEITLADDGYFTVFGVVTPFGSLAYGDLEWGAPIQIGYSYGSLHSGILELDLLDIDSVVLATLGDTDVFDIKGTIKNIQNPVPEPATMLLFGAGVTGLAAVRRRKKD